MDRMKTSLVILCEDEQSACFARRFLGERGWTKRDWRVEKAPCGEQSGEQWVRERLPFELTAMRAKGNTAVLALIDGDGKEVDDRIAELRRHSERKIEGRGAREAVPFVRADERVAIMVPKRNIETWLAFLRGEEVDENRNQAYRKYDAESDCKGQAVELHTRCDRSNLGDGAPPSLTAACDQYKKLPRRPDQ